MCGGVLTQQDGAPQGAPQALWLLWRWGGDSFIFPQAWLWGHWILLPFLLFRHSLTAQVSLKVLVLLEVTRCTADRCPSPPGLQKLNDWPFPAPEGGGRVKWGRDCGEPWGPGPLT